MSGNNIQTAFSCSSAMEKWKFQSRRNYKLHARVKGAGYELVLRNGISTPPLRTYLVSAPHFYGAIRTLCLTVFILPGEIAVCGCPVFVLGVIDTGSTISGRELSGFNNQIPARTRTSCLVSETKTGCSETKTGRSEKNLEWQFAANIFASV